MPELSSSEEVNTGDEEDEDEEDDQFGFYSSSDYVTEFKDNYANQQDLDLLMIRFVSTKEYEDTLRAFGIKVYNKKFYYISPADGQEMSYSTYCEKFDKITNINDVKVLRTSNYAIPASFKI